MPGAPIVRPCDRVGCSVPTKMKVDLTVDRELVPTQQSVLQKTENDVLELVVIGIGVIVVRRIWLLHAEPAIVCDPPLGVRHQNLETKIRHRKCITTIPTLAS